MYIIIYLIPDHQGQERPHDCQYGVGAINLCFLILTRIGRNLYTYRGTKMSTFNVNVTMTIFTIIEYSYFILVGVVLCNIKCRFYTNLMNIWMESIFKITTRSRYFIYRMQTFNSFE